MIISKFTFRTNTHQNLNVSDDIPVPRDGLLCLCSGHLIKILRLSLYIKMMSAFFFSRTLFCLNNTNSRGAHSAVPPDKPRRRVVRELLPVLLQARRNRIHRGHQDKTGILSWKPKKDIVRILCGHISLEIYVRTMSAPCPHNISRKIYVSRGRCCADIVRTLCEHISPGIYVCTISFFG